jgi:hypothetical protein
MIQVTYGDLNNPLLAMAMGKLVNYPKFKIKVAYRVGKIRTKLGKEQQQAADLWNKLILKYAETNDDGTPVLDETTRQPKVKESAKSEFEKEVQEFMKITVNLDYDQFLLEDLEGAGLTPNELASIECLILHTPGAQTEKSSA